MILLQLTIEEPCTDLVKWINYLKINKLCLSFVYELGITKKNVYLINYVWVYKECMEEIFLKNVQKYILGIISIFKNDVGFFVKKINKIGSTF